MSEKDVIEKYLGYAENCIKACFTVISAAVVYLFFHFDDLTVTQFVIIFVFLVIVLSVFLVAIAVIHRNLKRLKEL